MEFEGKITVLGKEETVGQNDLRKQTFVLEENNDNEYKSSIAIDLFKDKVDLLKDCKVGDVLKVGLNFRAKEYNDRYFNGISAWKVDVVSASNGTTDSDSLPF